MNCIKNEVISLLDKRLSKSKHRYNFVLKEQIVYGSNCATDALDFLNACEKTSSFLVWKPEDLILWDSKEEAGFMTDNPFGARSYLNLIKNLTCLGV